MAPGGFGPPPYTFSSDQRGVLTHTTTRAQECPVCNCNESVERRINSVQIKTFQIDRYVYVAHKKNINDSIFNSKKQRVSQMMSKDFNHHNITDPLYRYTNGVIISTSVKYNLHRTTCETSVQGVSVKYIIPNFSKVYSVTNLIPTFLFVQCVLTRKECDTSVQESMHKTCSSS